MFVSSINHPAHHKRWNKLPTTRCIAFPISDSPPRDTLYSHDLTGRARLERCTVEAAILPLLSSHGKFLPFDVCIISRCFCVEAGWLIKMGKLSLVVGRTLGRQGYHDLLTLCCDMSPRSGYGKREMYGVSYCHSDTVSISMLKMS